MIEKNHEWIPFIESCFMVNTKGDTILNFESIWKDFQLFTKMSKCDELLKKK